MNKKLVLILFVLALFLLGGYWLISSKKDTTQTSAYSSTNTSTNMSINQGASADAKQVQANKLASSPVVTMETSLGTITIRLYTAEAPELTKNFIELAKSGYYDGLTFHRIVPGFVVQGGDPSGNGTGGHSYKGEGPATGLADEPGALALKHYQGALAWAKSSLPNSIGSQFYFALDDIPALDGGYSVFGHVVSGFDVVEKIAAVPTDTSDKPLSPVTMTKVTVAE